MRPWMVSPLSLFSRRALGVGRTTALFIVVSTGTGAISGKGIRDTMSLGKGVAVFVGELGSFGLGSGEFVRLTTSRLFLGLLTGFGKIWGLPICSRLSRTFNRDKRLLCSADSAEYSC